LPLIVSAAMGDVIRDTADDVATGQSLYESKCSGCHSVDTDRIGPRHRNVVGRAVASIAEYDYSPALQQLGGTWTAVRLDQFLSGTQQMAPGSKMYLEIDDPVQRRLTISYLQTVSRPGAANNGAANNEPEGFGQLKQSPSTPP
jgi:cytochrome c